MRPGAGPSLASESRKDPQNRIMSCGEEWSETGLMLSWLCFLPGSGPVYQSSSIFLPGLPGGRATAGPGGRESCNMSYGGSGGSLHYAGE